MRDPGESEFFGVMLADPGYFCLAIWDGCDESGRTVASGTYCFRLEAGTVRMVKTVSLVR